MLFQGEFWCVKFIETKVSINKEHGPERDQSKQKINTKNSNKTSQQMSSVGLSTILLMFIIYHSKISEFLVGNFECPSQVRKRLYAGKVIHLHLLIVT